jgi:purine-cytosine permease-like protein
MENQNISPVPTALRWALILGLVGIATSIINYLSGGFSPENMDAPLPKLIRWGMYAIIILILVLAMQQHRDKDLGGYMKYGRGLGLGTLIGVFYGIIAAIMIFVMFKFFLPADYADKMIEATRDQMLEKNPNMTDEQMETGLSWVKKFMTPGAMTIFTFFGSVVICFFFSLIISAFIKKTNPNEIN